MKLDGSLSPTQGGLVAANVRWNVARVNHWPFSYGCPSPSVNKAPRSMSILHMIHIINVSTSKVKSAYHSKIFECSWKKSLILPDAFLEKAEVGSCAYCSSSSPSNHRNQEYTCAVHHLLGASSTQQSMRIAYKQTKQSQQAIDMGSY